MAMVAIAVCNLKPLPSRMFVITFREKAVQTPHQLRRLSFCLVPIPVNRLIVLLAQAMVFAGDYRNRITTPAPRLTLFCTLVAVLGGWCATNPQQKRAGRCAAKVRYSDLRLPSADAPRWDQPHQVSYRDAEYSR